MSIRKRGNAYFLDYWVNGRRVRESVGTSKKLAESILAKRKTDIVENRYFDIKKKRKVLFDDFANEYLELHSKLKKSYDTDYKVIDLWKKIFKGKCLHEITSFDIDKFKSARIKEVSPATVNRSLAVLKSMFNRAIAWDKADSNPCRVVKLFKLNNQRLRFLEKEEIPELLSKCCEHLKPIVTLALNTGMRKSEILKLKWQDIDFKRNTIHLYDTKNGEKREVPMNATAKQALENIIRHKSSSYAFCDNNGNPYGDIKKSFLTAVKNSSIINFHFHDLRHTFASQLVMAGIDLNTVRELLGHKSLEMTIRYSHLSPDHKKRAVDVLNRHIGTI